MMGFGRSIPRANKREAELQDQLREFGCAMCKLIGLHGCGPVRIHHRNFDDQPGQRQIGQHAVVGLGDWHHQGIPLPGVREREMLARFGPSYAKGTKPFRAFLQSHGLERGTTEELQEYAMRELEKQGYTYVAKPV